MELENIPWTCHLNCLISFFFFPPSWLLFKACVGSCEIRKKTAKQCNDSLWKAEERVHSAQMEKKYIYFNFQLELRIHFLVVFKPIVPILHHSKYKLERKAELSAYLGYSTC